MCLLAIANSPAPFSLGTLRHLLVSEYGKDNRNYGYYSVLQQQKKKKKKNLKIRMVCRYFSTFSAYCMGRVAQSI